MSMMTNNILCVVEQHLKQAMSIVETSPFETKLVLLVGDLTQLLPICKHTLRPNDILCKSCHVKSMACWKMPQIQNTYNFLTSFEKKKQSQRKFKNFYHHIFCKFKK
jgi:hypothetical protein